MSKQERRRTISGDTLIGASKSANSSTDSLHKNNDRTVRDGIDALDLQWSVKKLPRSKSHTGLASDAKKASKKSPLNRSKSLFTASDKVRKITNKLSVAGKRNRDTTDEGLLSGGTRFKKRA